MQRVGMTVDLSHCADRTTLDGIAAATKPVVFTHGAARGLMPGYARCKSDEALKALARNGGVMGIAFIRFMIRPEAPVTVEHVVDHFDYVIKLVGAEHVGIGSDLDMAGLGTPIPKGGVPRSRSRRKRTSSATTRTTPPTAGCTWTGWRIPSGSSTSSRRWAVAATATTPSASYSAGTSSARSGRAGRSSAQLAVPQ
jgi:microsomal dipeptidase-like Zn-dependent dipeptidase